MITLERNNTVILIKSALEKDNAHQLKFDDKSQQANYFLNRAYRTFTNVSFIRESVNGEPRNYIKLSMNIAECYNFNYVMFRNSNSDRYFYAFVTRVEYLSANATKIHLVADAFQNWQFDLNWYQCYIDRQTPANYNVRNTLADSPSEGQLVEIETRKVINFGCYLCICSTDITQDVVTDSTPYSLKVGNYKIPCWVLYWSEGNTIGMEETIQAINNKGWGDRILSIVYIPYINTDRITTKSISSEQIGNITLLTECGTNALTRELTISLPSTVYAKEGTYPYTKIILQDLTTGETLEYSPEKFENGVKFEYRGTISDTPSYSIIPVGYEGQTYAYDKALNVKCNTLLPNVNNQYATYLMNNSQQNKINVLGSVAGLGLSFGTMNPLAIGGSGVSLLSNVANVVAQENKASRLSNMVTNIVDDAQRRVIYENGFKVSIFRSDPDHLNTARAFWKVFGYPVRKMGIPNIGVGAYTYIKLLECNVAGQEVPQDELIQIKEMFLRGVTLWNKQNIYEY